MAGAAAGGTAVSSSQIPNNPFVQNALNFWVSNFSPNSNRFSPAWGSLCLATDQSPVTEPRLACHFRRSGGFSAASWNLAAKEQRTELEKHRRFCIWFTSQFKDEYKIPRGSIIDLSRERGYVLQTTNMRKALSQEVEKKSVIPLRGPITPDELEYD